jgi:hypothetical protein
MPLKPLLSLFNPGRRKLEHLLAAFLGEILITAHTRAVVGRNSYSAPNEPGFYGEDTNSDYGRQ